MFVGALAVLALVFPLALVPAAGVVIFLLARPFAPQLMLGFGAILFGASVILSDVPVGVGFFKLYGADLFIVFVVWGVMAKALDREGTRTHVAEQRFVYVLAIICAYGLFSAFLGFQRHHAYDEVLGWYRRLFFYMIPFVIPLWLPLQKRHIESIKYMILWGGLIVVMIAVYRIVTGQPVKEEIDFAVGHSSYRMVSVSEYCMLSMLLAYSIAVLRLRSDLVWRLVALAFAGITAVLLLLSGYRLGMLLAVGTPVLALGLTFWLRGGGLKKAIPTVFLVGVATIPAGILLTYILADQFSKALFDLEVRFQELAVVGDYRIWIWSEVLNQAKDQPLFGAGLGNEFVFLNRTRAGMFELKSASTHSTIMSFLNQTGLVGMTLFLGFHSAFVVFVGRRIRKVPGEYCGIAVALITAYLVVMAAGSLEPLRVAGYVALYFIMGLLVRLMREGAAVQPAVATS